MAIYSSTTNTDTSIASPLQSQMTLQDVLLEQQQTLEAIKIQQDCIKDKVACLMGTKQVKAAATSTSTLAHLMGSIDKVMAIYQGVTLGMRIVRKTRKLLRR